MNKEETLYEDLFEVEVIRRKQYQEENHELQQRINKAIEILKNIYKLDNVTITNNASEEIFKAIEILKGENNE